MSQFLNPGNFPGAQTISGGNIPDSESMKLKSEGETRIKELDNSQSRRFKQGELQLLVTSEEIARKCAVIESQAKDIEKIFLVVNGEIEEKVDSKVQKLKTTAKEFSVRMTTAMKEMQTTQIKTLGSDTKSQKREIESAKITITEQAEKAKSKIAQLQRQIDDTSRQLRIMSKTAGERLNAMKQQTQKLRNEMTLISSNKRPEVDITLPLQIRKLKRTAKNERTKIADALEKEGRSISKDVARLKSDVEARISNFENSISAQDSGFGIAAAEQERREARVKEIKEQNDKYSMETIEKTINDRLSETEKSIDEITSLLTDFRLAKDSEAGSCMEDINEVKAAVDAAVAELKSDYIKFHDNNRKIEAIVFEEIDRIEEIMRGKIDTVGRIMTAEERIKWCCTRIDKWKRREEKKVAMEVDDEHLISVLKEFEEQMLKIEEQMETSEIEGKDGMIEPFDLTGIEELDELAIPEKEEAENDKVEEMTLPPDLPLTYDDATREKDIFPDKIKNESGKSKSKGSETAETNKAAEEEEKND